jgi:hypothetical protein
MFNIVNILYLAFRLSPFIVVSFFALQSFLNWDMKGLIYLVGLLFSSFVTLLFSPIFERITKRAVDSADGTSADGTTPTEPAAECHMITLGSDKALSSLPLSTGVFSYTFFYLLSLVLNTARNRGTVGLNAPDFSAANLSVAMQENIPMMILFPLLIIVDGIWNIRYNCSNMLAIFISLVISGGMGIAWAMIILKVNNPDLLFITGNSADTCSRPRRSLFRCKVPPKTQPQPNQ